MGFDGELGEAYRPPVRYPSIKRGFDLSAALVAAVVLSPLLLAIGLIIRAGSAGPAIYCQTRIGRGRAPFCMLKFRSMCSGDSGTGHDDNRITSFGRFLRKYRLDELPQVFNIILGDMSWIGPRPQPVHYVETYAAQLEGYHARHAVRPGITGWAQVNQGHVTGLDGEAIKLSIDRQYIARLSLRVDALIAVRTIPVILRGGGR